MTPRRAGALPGDARTLLPAADAAWRRVLEGARRMPQDDDPQGRVPSRQRILYVRVRIRRGRPVVQQQHREAERIRQPRSGQTRGFLMPKQAGRQVQRHSVARGGPTLR